MKKTVNNVKLQFQVPETPQWLLSKGRVDDAEKSLRWLRGWVSSPLVAQEFADLQRHIKLSKSCKACIKEDRECSHPSPTLTEKLSELPRKRTIKPFVIIFSLSFLAEFSGISSMRPYLVQIFNAYEIPMSTDDAVVVTSIVGTLATVTFMCLIRFIGKRRLYLTVLLGSFLSSFVISYYGFICLPRGITSFNQSKEMNYLEDKDLAYIPMYCLFAWHFFAFCGCSFMQFLYLSELFAFK